MQEFSSVGKPIVNTIGPIEYRLCQRSLDERWRNGFFNDWPSHYDVTSKPPSEIQALIEDYISGFNTRVKDADGLVLPTGVQVPSGLAG